MVCALRKFCIVGGLGSGAGEVKVTRREELAARKSRETRLALRMHGWWVRTQGGPVWNKQRDETASHQQPEPVHSGGRPSAAQPQSFAQPSRSPSPAASAAAIGPSMRIKGEIHAREELTVNGEVEGLLESESL